MERFTSFISFEDDFDSTDLLETSFAGTCSSEGESHETSVAGSSQVESQETSVAGSSQGESQEI